MYLLKPLWNYGLQLWPMVKCQITSYLNKIRFQNITLKKITNSPRPHHTYLISNHTLNTDLNLKTVQEETKNYYKIPLTPQQSPISINKKYSDNSNSQELPRRLKCKWCRDLRPNISIEKKIKIPVGRVINGWLLPLSIFLLFFIN